MFFSVSQLHYGMNYPTEHEDYFKRSQALAIVTIVVLSIYSILRTILNPLAGIYMIKRLLLAVFLSLAYENLVFLAPVLIL